MIVICYQGIGKSTLAKNKNGYIDLESGCFWKNGNRIDDWYIYYCQIAEHLSNQGNVVFVSSHKPVRECLKSSNERTICVYPSILLSEEWKKKLHDRYEITKLTKDYKAWMNAEEMDKVNSVTTICRNETCKNDLCPHSMYAAPLDGTEVKLEDLFGTESCPYFAKRAEETKHDVDM